MKTRRQFIQTTLAATAGFAASTGVSQEKSEWKSLFDGKTLNGWKKIPRLYARKTVGASKTPITGDELYEKSMEWHRKHSPQRALEHTGEWKVVDGAIEGGQEPAGSRLGGYLMSEETYGDFELEYEMRPDWQTDTGILVRQHPIGTVGFQILCDHRPHGGIGGIFTNGLGSYLAAPFVLDGDADENFKVKNFRQGKHNPQFRKVALKDAATFEGFREVWKVNEWNKFRVRCVGANPVITTWVNDLKIGTLETEKPGVPDYDSSMIQRLVGKRGHIGLEVHSNSPKKGWTQWERGAVSRWRNIRVREIV